MPKRKRRRPAGRTRQQNLNPVRPGQVSPRRSVPDDIATPEYAETGQPLTMSEPSLQKSPAVIEAMRVAGRAARRVLAGVAAEIAPGVTSNHLDEVCHQLCLAEGGYPSPLNYKGYPKSLCTSVNEIICHGIPDNRPLADGDIVNCDVTIFLGGVHGDHSETFLVGDVDAESQRLVRVTREAMYHGISQVRPGVAVYEIGRAIEAHAEAAGFGVVREFIGHGIGAVFHQPPNVPHYYDPTATFVLEESMTFTVEPMITIGRPNALLWPDQWTAATVDGSRTAQFEHTVLVTSAGAELLTVSNEDPQPFLVSGTKTELTRRNSQADGRLAPQAWPAQLPAGTNADQPADAKSSQPTAATTRQ